VAVRKSVEEAFVVEGSRADWLAHCDGALRSRGFTAIAVDERLGQIRGNYKKLTTWGDLTVTLTPDGPAQTRIAATATANVDNVFALFKSPGRRIIDEFKSGLAALPAASETAGQAHTAAGGDGPGARHDEQETKTCPDCAETVLAAARVCKHCGYRFD
jgi:Uncharacterised protein family UPF0547